MTADERLEKLLNRAGQTITDFPTWDGNMRRLGRAKRDALTEMGYRWTDYSPTLSADEIPLTEYILRLAGIIDRMETALENVLVERDWFVEMSGRIGFCFACGHWNESADECDVGYKCDPNSREGLLYSYSGVPEDWRVDE